MYAAEAHVYEDGAAPEQRPQRGEHVLDAVAVDGEAQKFVVYLFGIDEPSGLPVYDGGLSRGLLCRGRRIFPGPRIIGKPSRSAAASASRGISSMKRPDFTPRPAAFFLCS